MNKVLLLGAGVALTGTFVRLIKSDTLSDVLESKGFGAVPKLWLPRLSVILAFVYAFLLEVQLHGFAAWQDALVLALLEGLGIGIFTSGAHDLGKGVPGVKRVLGVLLIVGGLSSTSMACSLLKPLAVHLLNETAKCIVSHPDLTDTENFKLCGVGKAEEPAATELLDQTRAVTAKAAADASARAGAARCVAPGQ